MASPPGSVASSTRSTTRPPRIANTWIAPPLGPTFNPKTSRSPSPGVATFCCRSRRTCTVRSASRSCAASSNRSASDASVMRSRSVAISSSLRPSSSSLRARHRHPYRSSVQISATHGAMQRLMSYSRHGRPRCPVITSLHDRMPNKPVRQTHRPTSQLGRQERSRVEVAALLDAPRHEHPRKRLARRQLQIRIVLVVAQQDVVLRRPLLDQVVLERERLHHRVGDDHLDRRDLLEQRVVARAEPRRRPGSCAHGPSARAPCRRRSSRRRRCATDRRRAARAAARSDP